MSGEVTIEELERWRVMAAYWVLELGPEYGFVLERVEKELEKARADDPVAKAKKVLDELKAVDGVVVGGRPKLLESKRS
jgi:hypothetical protein